MIPPNINRPKMTISKVARRNMSYPPPPQPDETWKTTNVWNKTIWFLFSATNYPAASCRPHNCESVFIELGCCCRHIISLPRTFMNALLLIVYFSHILVASSNNTQNGDRRMGVTFLSRLDLDRRCFRSMVYAAELTLS